MTDRSSIELELRRQIARLVALNPDQVAPSSWVNRYDIDSLDLLLLRESIERTANVVISDDTWLAIASIAELADHIAASQKEGAQLQMPSARTLRSDQLGATTASRQLDQNGILCDEVEIGMSLTGQANLAESPLLKYLGDLRWSHMTAVSGVPSRTVIDADGHRLYPAFFYVELEFPEHAPMATYQENDRLRVYATLGRFGESMLDGVSYFFNPTSPIPEDLIGKDVASAAAAGFPAARLTNVFVNRHGGSEWLKRSLPANPGFDRIPSLKNVPDSFHRVRSAEATAKFHGPESNDLALTARPMKRELQIVPERDLNGAGLVYFANFPLFLDVCERDLLAGCEPHFSAESIHQRTLVKRQSAYLHNASFDDTLLVETEGWIRGAPGQIPYGRTGASLILINQRMWRKSDQRLMMISTTRKLIPDLND